MAILILSLSKDWIVSSIDLYEMIRNSSFPTTWNELGEEPSCCVLTDKNFIIQTFTSDCCDILGFNSNVINFSNNDISSNMVTILISGFGSENDIHSLEWRKFLENAPINSNYYFYHWPGASLTKIILKSLPIGLHGIKFDSDLPQVFLDSKKKAVVCGKMLAIILKSKMVLQLEL